MAQLVVRSTVDVRVRCAFDCRCVVGLSPRGAEHFGFPPSAPRLGNQRPWYVQRIYATGHIKDPMPLIAKRRGLSPGGRFPPSFIHQVIIITGLNKLYSRVASIRHCRHVPTYFFPEMKKLKCQKMQYKPKNKRRWRL